MKPTELDIRTSKDKTWASIILFANSLFPGALAFVLVFVVENKVLTFSSVWPGVHYVA